MRSHKDLVMVPVLNDLEGISQTPGGTTQYFSAVMVKQNLCIPRWDISVYEQQEMAA